MDDYVWVLVESVKSDYSSYKRAMREYLDSSYIDENGELIYSVTAATHVNDTKEMFEQSYKELQIAKNIINFEG